MPGWQKLAHHATHLALYTLFFAVPLTGWAYSSAAGFPIVLFGLLPLPDFVPVSEGLADVLKELHELSAFAMAGLVLPARGVCPRLHAARARAAAREWRQSRRCGGCPPAALLQCL